MEARKRATLQMGTNLLNEAFQLNCAAYFAQTVFLAPAWLQ